MDSVILLSVVGMAVFMRFGVASPITSPYAEFPQADYFMIGLLSTAGSLTAFLAGYFWGRQSDKMARRKVFLAAGLAGSCLSSGPMAVIPSYLYLFPLRILQALSQAAYSTTSLTLMGDLLEQPGARGRTMRIYRGLGSLGFALMASVSGSIADRSCLRRPFVWEADFLGLAFLLSLLVHDTAAAAGRCRHHQSKMGIRPEASSQADRGRASGLYSSARGLGSIVGGTFGGSLTQFLGFVRMMLICAGLLLGGALYLTGTCVWQRRPLADRQLRWERS